MENMSSALKITRRLNPKHDSSALWLNLCLMAQFSSSHLQKKPLLSTQNTQRVRFLSLTSWNCTVLGFAFKWRRITPLRLVLLKLTRAWLLCSHLTKEPHRGGKHNKNTRTLAPSCFCFLISQKTSTWTNHNGVSSSDLCAYFHLFWEKKAK